MVKYIKKLNLFLFFLTVFSMITMRGVMNITSFVLLILSIVLLFLDKEKNVNKNKILWGLVICYPLAIFLNIFSLAGVDGMRNTASRFYYPLLVMALLINNFKFKHFKCIKKIIEIAILLACFWSFYLYFTPGALNHYYPGNHNGIGRLRSFESVGRWSVYLMMGLVWKFTDFFTEKKRLMQIYNIIYFLILSYAILLNNGRGGWLGFAVGILFFVIFSMEKKIITVVLIFIIIILFTFKHEYFRRYTLRAKTILNTKTNNSNRKRLETWKVGFDIAKENLLFGVGYEKNQKYVLEYRKKMKKMKTKEYVKRYLSYSWVIEGSYVAILAQNGLIYLFYYLFIIIAGLFTNILFKAYKLSGVEKLKLLGVLSVIFSYFFLQWFYLDLQSYSVYFPYILFYFCIKKLEETEFKKG